jgi:hypothetical protein
MTCVNAGEAAHTLESEKEDIAMTGWRQWSAIVPGLACMVVGPSLAAAQQTDMQPQGPAATAAPESDDKPPNTGRVSLTLGADWVSAY